MCKPLGVVVGNPVSDTPSGTVAVAVVPVVVVSSSGTPIRKLDKFSLNLLYLI